MAIIHLPRNIVHFILAHAQRHEDREVCGFIASRNGNPTRCFEIANVAPDPATRFEMDPAAQINAMRAMREAGEELFAIYHSHPQGPARPSTIDLAEAAYPNALYLIVSLHAAGVLEMRGYYIRKGQTEEVELSQGVMDIISHQDDGPSLDPSIHTGSDSESKRWP